jgi:hypothetical protein
MSKTNKNHNETSEAVKPFSSNDDKTHKKGTPGAASNIAGQYTSSKRAKKTSVWVTRDATTGRFVSTGVRTPIPASPGVRGASTPPTPQAVITTTLQPNTGRALLSELRESGFIGMWKDRKDIGDSSAFARRLREGVDVRADREDREESVS